MTEDRKRPDPLGDEERREELRRSRPKRSLPVAPDAPPAKRKLPLLAARAKDEHYRPIYAVWEITLACDLACRHCGSRAGKARPDELTTEECLDLVHQLAALGVQEVSLIGGEAYLRDDWLDIVREIRAQGMIALMTSGGRGITAELAQAAAEAGLQSVSISIDGLEETHDRLRGVKGSFKSAMMALKHLTAAGIQVSVNTQINRLSMPQLHDVLDVLVANGGHSWQLQLTVAMGRAADEPDVLLQPYDLLSLFPLLGDLKDRCVENKVRMWPGNNLGYFGPYESKLRGTMARGHMASCGAGRLSVGIEADGTVKGCPSLTTEDWAGGNIRDNSLREIWEQAEPLRYTRDRTVEDLWGFCRTCYYADECRAGCTWTTEVLFDRPGNNPYCHHRALEREREGLRERVVRVEEAPGLPFDHGLFDVILEPLPTAEENLQQESSAPAE